MTEDYCNANLVRDEEIDDADLKEDRNTMLVHLGASMFSEIQRLVNEFVVSVNGFKDDKVNYTVTVSFYIEEKYWKFLEQKKLVD